MLYPAAESLQALQEKGGTQGWGGASKGGGLEVWESYLGQGLKQCLAISAVAAAEITWSACPSCCFYSSSKVSMYLAAEARATMWGYFC